MTWRESYTKCVPTNTDVVEKYPIGKEAADGRREGSLEVRLKSRDDAAFDTLERAKHWTAFHVAQTLVP